VVADASLPAGHRVGSRRPARAAAGAVVVLGAACAVSAAIDPSGGPVLCPFRVATGLDCPLCGATRAAHHLFRGDVVGALGLNALFVVFAPLLLVGAFVVLRQAFGGPPVRVPYLSRSAVVALLAVVVAFTVVRNLGVAPFDWLSTTA
jgi:hypothetical protein